MADIEREYMKVAFEVAEEGMADGLGGPFGAVVVKDGEIIATGANRVVRDLDPTAHAEIVAVRAACRALGTHSLEGCELFCTTEPCSMCLSAIYWARLDRVWYAATREQAAQSGFDDMVIYKEVSLGIDERQLPMIRLETGDSAALFDAWRRLPSKVPY